MTRLAIATLAAVVVARAVRHARAHRLCPEWGPGSCRHWGHEREDDGADLREHCERMGAA